MVEATSETDSDIKYLASELKQRITNEDYLAKCRSFIEARFENKKWGGPELRKTEMMLEGEIKDELLKDRVNELFSSLESHPPSARIKHACAENMTRSGGKLLDRSKYTTNPPLTPEMIEAARSFSKTCLNQAWEAELYPFGEKDIIRWSTNMEISINHVRNLV